MGNLLANGMLGYGVKPIDDVSLNWIGKLIRILIEGIGIVGVGIIVFTLILKTIVLPLDIYSRIKGKKQALIMERMRPQMEKLQKQYANDKAMYNQKVMELQKASGYSMFGACLPMIVSLVIFIIVFNAFSTYSQFANLNSYNKMVEVYNGKVQTYVIDATDEYGNTIVDENGNIVINEDGFLNEVILNRAELDENRAEHAADESVKLIKAEKDYTVRYDYFTAAYNQSKGTSYGTADEVFSALSAEYKAVHTGYDGAIDFTQVNALQPDGSLTHTAVELRNTLVSFYLEGPASRAVYEYYTGKDYYDEKVKVGEAHNDSFLWVKNLWYPDSTLNRAVPDFAKFKSTISKANISDDYQESYEKVTAALTAQKKAYNGYFILIVLSIGLMLVQQIISMKANKSVNDLSTVDGSGARTNKWMLVMMPIIYGIFSFFYSASFSVYMITNTVYGLITMLIINKCVDVWFKKKEEAGELDKVLNKKKRKVRERSAGNYRRK